MILLVVYGLSVPYFLRGGSRPKPGADPAPGGARDDQLAAEPEPEPVPKAVEEVWPLNLAILVLAVASVAAAFAADWFVSPLQARPQPWVCPKPSQVS